MSFDFSGADTVDRPDLLALARAGEDWFCSSCEAGNRGDTAACIECGAPRPDPEPPRDVSGRRAPRRSTPGILDRAPRSRPRSRETREPADRTGDWLTEPDVPEPRRRSRVLSLLDRWWPVAVGVPVLALPGASLGALYLYDEVPAVRDSVSSFFGPEDEIVEATVTGRTWVRRVSGRRLTAEAATTWREEVPAPAVLPPERALQEGHGDDLACEELRCLPNPGPGGRLIEVRGRSWSRSWVVLQVRRDRGEGWRKDKPYAATLLSCKDKVTQRRHCQTLTRQVECGTTSRCTTRDLGNGFAEQTCQAGEPRYCTESEEVCTPEERDEWCTWEEETWREGRTRTNRGNEEAPSWPSKPNTGHDTRAEQRQTNELFGRALVGGGTGRVSVDEYTMRNTPAGTWLLVDAKGVHPVPDDEKPSGDGPIGDCGPRHDPKASPTRERCTYTHWTWERLEGATNRSKDGLPEWPEVDPDAYTELDRDQHVVLELAWDSHWGPNTTSLRATLKNAKGWKVGHTTAVRVGKRGLIEPIGDWPR